MKAVLVLAMISCIAACTTTPPTAQTVATPSWPPSTSTPGICDGMKEWAADVAAVYEAYVSGAARVHGDISATMAGQRSRSVLQAWNSLTAMTPPPIATSTHDLLRRSLVYEVTAMQAYLTRQYDTAGSLDARFVEALDEFGERRDLILALCGIDQAELLAKIKGSHALEDVTQRMMLATDPEEREEWRHKANDVIDAAIARPEAERVAAIELIKSIAGEAAIVDYLSTIPGLTGKEENYAVGPTLYVVNVATGTLVTINELPRHSLDEPQRTLDFTDRYTQDELESQARSFISRYAPDLDLARLTFSRRCEDNPDYPLCWFVWEDLAAKYAKLQIALTPAGDIAAYLNTLVARPQP